MRSDMTARGGGAYPRFIRSYNCKETERSEEGGLGNFSWIMGSTLIVV